MRISTTLALVLALLASAPAQKGRAYVADLQAYFKEVEANYPFFKVKGLSKGWTKSKKALLKRARACKNDAGFIPIVRDALAQLRDGHAGIIEIRPKVEAPERDYWPGVVLMRATKGRVVVVAAPKGLANQLPRGALVDRIGNKKARKVLDERGKKAWHEGGFFSSLQRATFFEYRMALSGKRGDAHELLVVREGRRRKVTVRATYEIKGWLHLYNPPEKLEKSARSVWHATLADDVGYVWLRRMDDSAESGIQKAIAAHPGAKKWIVDLRGNSGGGYSRSMKQTIAGFGRKVAVIIDAGAVSAAETFTRDLVNVCRARTFGAVTAGSSSSKKTWTYPSGIATIRYSVRSRSGVGGKPIEFNGIAPDQPIEADPKDVAAGKNTEILAALKWLRR